MKTFKIAFGILASAALFTLASGCKPNETTPDPTPTAEEMCYPETIKNGALDYEKFEYDAQHKPVKYYLYNNGAPNGYYKMLYTNDKLSAVVRYTQANVIDQNIEFIYGSNGKLLQQKGYSATGTLMNRTDYEYDATQRPSRMTYFNSASGGVLFSDEYYIFDYIGTDIRPIREKGFYGSGSPSTVRNYTYDSNGNITNESYTNISSGSSNTTARTFDNKKSALISFAGFGDRSYTGSSDQLRVVGKNNITSIITTHFDSNGNQTSRGVTNFTYEYDSKGYPTKQNILPTSASSTNSTLNFTYHCH
jgi:antitoxin component YwqK of YwqJK toxin-antitoxin module